MTRLNKWQRRAIAFHVMAVVVLLGIVALGVLRVPQVFYRTFEALRDLVRCFYSPTSNQLPRDIVEGFPRAWDDVVTIGKTALTRLFTLENVYAYFGFLAEILGKISLWLLYLFTFIALPYIAFVCISVQIYNTEHNRQSRPLRIFLKFYKHVFLRAKIFIKRFFRFFKRKKYHIALICITLFFLNIYTIGIEFFAWYISFLVHEGDLVGLGIQLIKLLYDVYSGIRFLPWPVWIVIGLVGFDRWRRWRGFHMLEKLEKKFRDFLLTLAIAVLVTAPMREGKTTFLQNAGRTFEKIFKEQAHDAMRQIDLHFPNFPWIVLEKAVQRGANDKELKNITLTHDWAQNICELHQKYANNPAMARHYRRELTRKYKIKFNNILFGYDTKLWPMTYDIGLGEETIYDAIVDYAQLYRIYLEPSIIASNFPARMDDDLVNHGNEICWEDDFYRKKPSPLNKSRWARILRWDWFRPGKKVNPEDPYKNAFEYGIALDTEMAKDRGNQYDKAGKSKDSDTANILNDLFNKNHKMIGHSANVRFITFVRWLGDEQRAGSLNADLLQTMDIITLQEKSKPKILMPFFAFGELLWNFSQKVLGKIFDEKMTNRGDLTLSMWFLHNVIQAKINRHYENINGLFGGYTVKVFVQDAMQRKQPKIVKVFMSNRKNFAQYFQTDPWHDSFREKARTAQYGIGDVPAWNSLEATVEQLDQQGSYHFEELKKYFIEEAMAELERHAAEERAARRAAEATRRAVSPEMSENPTNDPTANTSENNLTE